MPIALPLFALILAVLLFFIDAMLFWPAGDRPRGGGELVPHRVPDLSGP